MKKFGVTFIHNVPFRVGLELEEFDEDETTESWSFREIVGGLMWSSISTRPDISMPKPIHWKAALGILAHINDTSGFGITYQSGTLASVSLEFFGDADYASKATDRRSVSGGGAIMCGGACVCWFSRTQKCVTLSTSEAEYIALGDAVKELSFLRQV